MIKNKKQASKFWTGVLCLELWVFDWRENITQLWTELYAFGGGLIYSSGVFIVEVVLGFLESGSVPLGIQRIAVCIYDEVVVGTRYRILECTRRKWKLNSRRAREREREVIMY